MPGDTAQESFVQVAPDNPAGKYVRNYAIDLVQPDGSIKTVQLQGVVGVRLDGSAADVDSASTNAILSDIRTLLQQLVQQTALRTGASPFGV